MTLTYRGIDLWDTATGTRILDAIDGDRVPPAIAEAQLGGDPDPLDLLMGLALLSGRLTNPDLAARVDAAADHVRTLVTL
jgi:hypothetical protein